MNAVGRPSSYSEQTAEYICEQLSRGQSLRSICESEGLPTKETVFSWLTRHPDFYASYTRARVAQAEMMDERIVDVADRCERGELDPNAARVAIQAYQWRASKLAPRVYGEAQLLKHADADGNVLRVEVTRVQSRKQRVIDVTPRPADALPAAPAEPTDQG